MRYFYADLYQGEGISGRGSIVGAATHGLYSCMGIAIVNRNEQRGGLYHYPGSTIKNNANVMSTIRRMVNDIQPTEIVITPAGGQPLGGVQSEDDDIREVQNTLKGLTSASIRIEPGRALAQLVWVDGKPIYNKMPDADDVDLAVGDGQQEKVPQQLRGVMSPIPRDLGNGVLYYGGDGEPLGLGGHNVLEQGLGSSTANPAPSRSGRVRRRDRLRRSISERCIVM